MATSGSRTVALTKDFRLVLSWKTISQNVSNNTSSVEATLKFVADYRMNSSASKKGSITINGNKKNFNFVIGSFGAGTKTLGTHRVTVPHTNNGSKKTTIAGSAGLNVTLSGKYVGTKSLSTTATLNTIPRTSTISSVTGSTTLGSAFTINVSRKATAFTHTIRVKYGGSTSVMHTRVAGTRYSVTPPTSWANRIKTSNSATATIYVDTYNGTTLVGTRTTTRTLKVPSGNPKINNSVTHIRNTAPVGFTYTQGLSQIRIVGTATATYGATIKTVRITANGQTFTKSGTHTTGVIKDSGTNTIRWEFTDTRGRKTTTSQTISVQAYSYPKVSIEDVFRSNASGSIDIENGLYINAKVSSSYSNVTGNSIVSRGIRYRKTNTTPWTTTQATTSPQTLRPSGIDINSGYEVIGYIQDKVRTTETSIVTIDSAFVLMNFHKSGRAIGFGEVAQNSWGMGINMPAIFKDDLQIKKGLTVDKSIDFDGSGASIKFHGGANKHSYMEFYKGKGSPRHAYFGIPSFSNNRTVLRSIEGDLLLQGMSSTSLVLTADSAGKQIYSKDIYSRTYSSAPNVFITTYGTLGRSTSASKYKLSIKEIDVKDFAERILDLDVKSWYDKTATEQFASYLDEKILGKKVDIDKLDIPDLKRHYGLIAEDLVEAGLTEYVSYGDDGQVEGIEYDRLWTLLIPLVRNLKEENKILNSRLNEQDKRINDMEQQIQLLLKR